MPAKPRLLVALRPALYTELFSPEADARLRHACELQIQPSADDLSSAQLARLLPGCDIVITGWGTPVFSDEVLAAADNLRLIAHSAGSIKRMLPPAVFAAGRRVTHAAAAMQIPVAETTLLFILLSLRRFHQIDRVFKDQGWAPARAFPPGAELAGARIGVIGAGYTGRELIKKLSALEAEVWLCDPYVTDTAAAALGARKSALEPLMRNCPVVTLQAPATAETYRMIGAEQFSWLADGAIFVNTARAHLIDEAALLAELQSGRISAALDVFEREPLPANSPFRQLDNVIITPHIASVTRGARRRQGDIIAGEVARFLRDGKLHFEVTLAMLDTMA